jgi:hypothetical protein
MNEWISEEKISDEDPSNMAKDYLSINDLESNRMINFIKIYIIKNNFYFIFL